MKHLLTLEEAAQFLLSILLFNQLHYAWWVFPAWLLVPDLSMIGYVINTQIGALLYNFFHHKLLAIAVYALGIWLQQPQLILAGIILFGHSAMDRVFGYGLKYSDDFKNTHLGWIGGKS
ncbi:MAG TPA: DUF4260 domain-containing protein [Flavobacteriales bacterium]|nr:DUF4260 domain-containing protein [Flavobacteriales bacterium]HRJ36977.1 DUF4260 domain-containing protein [Flavobacteriales bacterium]HRJ39120.1 DUF4260 domain-containing protein [Flavobacteriales bacterium]